jgi:hypothetical protein
MAVTWIEVIELAREMEERRRQTGQVGEAEAKRLLTMVLDFHQHAVAGMPSTGARSTTGRDTDGQAG